MSGEFAKLLVENEKWLMVWRSLYPLVYNSTAEEMAARFTKEEEDDEDEDEDENENED